MVGRTRTDLSHTDVGDGAWTQDWIWTALDWQTWGHLLEPDVGEVTTPCACERVRACAFGGCVYVCVSMSVRVRVAYSNPYVVDDAAHAALLLRRVGPMRHVIGNTADKRRSHPGRQARLHTTHPQTHTQTHMRTHTYAYVFYQ